MTTPSPQQVAAQFERWYEFQHDLYATYSKEDVKTAWMAGRNSCASSTATLEAERDAALEVYKLKCVEHDQCHRELEDWRHGAKNAADETCGKDQKHCTCVGVLRQTIKSLTHALTQAREEVAASKELGYGCHKHHQGACKPLTVCWLEMEDTQTRLAQATASRDRLREAIKKHLDCGDCRNGITSTQDRCKTCDGKGLVACQTDFALLDAALTEPEQG